MRWKESEACNKELKRKREKERRERKKLKICRYRYKLKIEDRQKVSEREINENVKRC